MAVGVYSVLKRPGVSIVCLTGQGCLFCASWDTGSDMCLTWHWVFVLCSTGQGFILCDPHDRGVYSVPPGTQGIQYVHQMHVDVISVPLGTQGILYVPHKAVRVYSVPNLVGVSIVCLLGHRRIQYVLQRAVVVYWLCERTEGP